MNSFLKNIILKTTFRDDKVDKSNISDYIFAKTYKKFKITVKHNIKDVFLILLGILSASFGFKAFLLTNNFIDGGATGISLLIASLSKIPLYILIICVNLPFVFLGYNLIGKQFAIKTSFAIGGLSLALATLTFPNITDDNLLVAVFGGFFLGAGIGFTIRGGAVIDGTEVLAIYLSRKFGTTIGDVIIIINILIFGAAAYFLGIDVALYSMITYLAASKTLDFIVEGIEEYIGVTIVSSHNEEIREMIINTMRRGVTVYSGKKGYGNRGETKETDIVYTVITRLELNKLMTEIDKISTSAFVVMNSVKDTRGGMIKKRPLKH
ncbi:YitT family protein [Flavobacterium sp.]|jgi:uncharacterized membrane-anchored protein YitT (DUF2179 family)|uniref:YitT family protein n=1 Tax=Flavobacterium sp. TaxID=239 RepID=UPI0037BFBA63